MKFVSKSALCATSAEPSQNSKNRGKTISIVSASLSIASVICVSSSISYGIDISGLTNSENLSVIIPLHTFTAPISITLCLYGLRPVVSISKITYESSKDCPASFLTIGFSSSTR